MLVAVVVRWVALTKAPVVAAALVVARQVLVDQPFQPLLLTGGEVVVVVVYFANLILVPLAVVPAVPVL
jgi:hypothetical protein